MADCELVHLQLLAEIDALVARLRHWAEAAPDWATAASCQALVRRLAGRADALRTRLEAPLVVALLGGTGTGKSALVNALAGSEVVRTGRQRPTTTRPTVVCRSGLTAEMLGLDPHNVEVVARDLPTLAQLVLVDCPDPDTTEALTAGSTLARLRDILPHCDVLLVVTSQQKYRSARVEEELAAAAPGATLVFVQTHAAVDADIRDDWRSLLAERFPVGHIFLVDSLSAAADIEQGLEPRGEMAGLVDLLARQLAGAAATRIRRTNFLDLAVETLDDCQRRIAAAMPAVETLQTAIEAQRERLADILAGRVRGQLLSQRQWWERRVLTAVAAHWGLSPFALVLRIFLGLGRLLGWRPVRRGPLLTMRTAHRAQEPDLSPLAAWDPLELRAAALVLEGYAVEAGLDRKAAAVETIAAEGRRAALAFAERLGSELQGVVDRLARRHTGWWTRWRYELLLVAMLGFVLLRLAKNFFYDSWWPTPPAQVWGLESYLVAGFWLLLWSLVLLWMFAGRVRRGLRQEIAQAAAGWTGGVAAAGLFAALEGECRRAKQFCEDLDTLRQDVARVRRQVASSPK